MEVYRNPGLQLTHFPGGDGERTLCKHYRLPKMDKIDHNESHAALWCTDCLMGAIRLQKEQDEPD